jgi:pilus assembly protein CpaE
MIVCNKVPQGTTEISKADFEASIERKINFMIPLDQKAGVNAAKLGQTFVEANKGSKAVAVMRDIANAVVGVSSDNGASLADAGKGSSLLGKLDFKSLLAKKAPKATEPAE